VSKKVLQKEISDSIRKLHGTICPKCGSTDIEFGTPVFPNLSGDGFQKNRCNECGYEFTVKILRNSGIHILDRGRR